MFELLLALVTSAASTIAAMVLARDRPRARQTFDLFAALRAIALAAVLFAAGATVSWPHVIAGAWLGGSALAGSVFATLAAFLAPSPPADHAIDDVAGRALGLVIEQGVVLVGVSAALFVGCALTGALRDPQTLAPAAPLLVVGFAAGAQAAPPSRGRRVAVEIVLVMVPLAALFQRNAAVLRAGPVATSALGLFVLPVAVRALGLVALGASSVAARRQRNEEAGAASARASWVFASLMALAVLGASFTMAGVFWPSALFCGVAGVAASLVVWRASRSGATAITALAAASGAFLASVAVGERTGLVRSVAFSIPLVCMGLSASGDAFEALDVPNAWSRLVTTLALAPLALLAIADETTRAACTRWAIAERLPQTDPATLLSKCTAARVAVDRVDLLHPAVMLGVATGAVLVWDTGEEDGAIVPAIRIAAALAALVGLRLAFGTGGPAAAALVSSALVTAAIARGEMRGRVAYALAAVALGLAAVYA
jgi:hypothetical protein